MIGTILLAIPGFILLWVLITYVEHLISLRKYPKGPFPLPLLGNLKLLGKKPFLDFIKLSKTYGDVFSMSFGMKRVVVINSYEAIKEALVTRGHDFAGRPNDNISLGIQSNNFQSLESKDYSKSWSFLRKLTYKSLHFYGTGIKNVEDLVMEDVEEMVSLLSKEVGNPILIHKYFGNTTINTISNICFSKRYLPTDPKFLDILRFSHQINLGCAPGQLISVFPWLQYFPDTERFRNLKIGSKDRQAHTHRMFNEHIATFNPDKMRDLTDHLLYYSQNKELWKDAGFEKVTQMQLESVVNTISFAGMETNFTTLRWLVIYLLNYPEYQTKIYQEILTKIDAKRSIKPEDINLLPFVHATVLETNRYSSVAPFALPHKAIVDTSVGGHHIPKGSKVFLNFYNCNHDPTHWDEPEKFKPERWLNADGSVNKEKKATHYLPFGAGTRVCIGQKLAEFQLFSSLTNLMRNFEISLPLGEPLPGMQDGILGATYEPATKYKVVLSRR